MRILLETNTGEPVLGCDIPPFNARPDVIFWGARVFHYFATTTDQATAPVTTYRYRECFAYTITGREGTSAP